MALEPLSTSVTIGENGPTIDGTYWLGLIDERAVAEFLGLSVRTVQALRQRGGGPKYVRLSARCIRYRRADLKQWADERLVASTADPGFQPDPAVAAA